MNNREGLSLLEILVALLLGSLILSFAVNIKYDFSNRDRMETTLDKVERAVRFAVDEAALKNAVIRIRFFLEKRPQEFTVEFSNDADFVIPKAATTLSDDDSENEVKGQEKVMEKMNSGFNVVKEFQDDPEEIPRGVYIIGIGTSLYDSFITENETSIFIYPSGEKDGAILLLGSDQEMASLKIEEFTTEFKKEFIEHEDLSQDDQQILDYQIEKAREIFERWKTN